MSTSNYTPGQILTAAALNASFDAKVDAAEAAITGGTIAGLTSLQITGTADSTSPVTGALTVAGGVGVELDMQVGGDVTVEGEVIANATTQSTSNTTGAIVVIGGVGIGGNVNIGGSVGIAGSLTVTDPIEAASTEDSTSTTTGAIIVEGGLGVALSVTVGDNLTVGETLNVAGAAQITATTDTTGPTTGALIVTGGVGISKNLQVAQKVTTQTASVAAATASTSPSTGALVVTGGVGVGGAINSTGNLSVGGTATLDGAVDIVSATASTSPTTGALIVAGGVGVGGAINASGLVSSDHVATTNAAVASTFAGAVDVTNATASTSPTTGALIVAGGAGVAGALNVAGGATIGSDTTISGLIGAKGHSNLLYNSTGEFGNIGWTGTTFSGQNDATGAGGSMFSNILALTTAASDVSQNIPVGAAVPLSLTGDILTSGVTSGTIALTLTAFSSANANLGTVCSITLANGTAFTRETATGTTPANTAYVQLTKSISGGSVAATALGVGFKRIKIENSAFATLYSQEASFAATSSMSTANPTIASGPLTFSDGSQQISAASGKNKIINGQCMFAQRAAVTIAGARVYGGPDRYCGAVNGAGGSYSLSSGTLTFNGVTYSTAQASSVSAASSFSGTNNWIGITQQIEGFNCYDMVGQPISVQFLFTASISGTYSVSLCDSTSNFSIVGTFTAVANTPKLVNINWPAIPSGATIPRSSAMGLWLRIGGINNGGIATSTLNVWQSGGAFLCATGTTQWSQTVGATIGVTKVQLEAGSVCTPFEEEDVGITGYRCLRYHNSIGFNGIAIAGYNPSAGNATTSGLPIPVSMRTTPAVTANISSSSNVTSIGCGATSNNITPNANTPAAGLFLALANIALDAEL